MSKQAAEHHHKAAEHHEHAARHHKEAAKHHEAGKHETAAHHAHLARAHHEHATHHAVEAAKAHLEHHGKASPALEIAPTGCHLGLIRIMRGVMSATGLYGRTDQTRTPD